MSVTLTLSEYNIIHKSHVKYSDLLDERNDLLDENKEHDIAYKELQTKYNDLMSKGNAITTARNNVIIKYNALVVKYDALQTKYEALVDEDEDEELEVDKFTHTDGKEYLRGEDGVIYDVKTEDPIGKWDDEKKTILLTSLDAVD
jgi:recombinational DNA repair ATPase RecF